MNAGGAERGYLETLADWTLAFPRVLWHKRSVEILRETPDFKINVAPKTSYLGTLEELSDQYAWVLPVVILCSPIAAVFYAAIAVLIATPLLGVGLLLKKTALFFDEKTQAYSDYAQSLLEQKVLKEEEEAWIKHKNQVTTGIKRQGFEDLDGEDVDLKALPLQSTPTQEQRRQLFREGIQKLNSQILLAQAEVARVGEDVAAKKAAFKKFYN